MINTCDHGKPNKLCYECELEQEITRLRAEVERIPTLVEEAYTQGFYRSQQPGVDSDDRVNQWLESRAYKELENKYQQQSVILQHRFDQQDVVDHLRAEVERLQNVCDVASVTINSKFDRARKDTATRCAEIAHNYRGEALRGAHRSSEGIAIAIRKEFGL